MAKNFLHLNEKAEVVVFGPLSSSPIISNNSGPFSADSYAKKLGDSKLNFLVYLGISQSLVKRLQLVQNAMARLERG